MDNPIGNVFAAVVTLLAMTLLTILLVKGVIWAWNL